MIPLKNRTNLIAASIGDMIAAVALYQIPTRRIRFGQHSPLQLYPSRPVPGTASRMARGVR